jgi:N-lysine methyltransferase SETD6
MVLSVDNSILREHIAEALDNLDPWLASIVVMMHEWCLAAEDKKSYWEPYFKILPMQSPDFAPLMYWQEESLQLLRPSPVLDRIGSKQAHDLFQENVKPFLVKWKDVFHPSLTREGQEHDRDFVFPLFNRVASIIMAYAFDLEKSEAKKQEDEEGYVSDEEDEMLPKGMVPMADMFNANADLNNVLSDYQAVAICWLIANRLVSSMKMMSYLCGPSSESNLVRRSSMIMDRFHDLSSSADMAM